ncbi:hypothetical protein D918_05935 [Trichuris suis]|nr:hypothetical protein D918_05935 [Trichuris suis]
MHALAIAALHIVLFYCTSDCLLSKQGKKNMTAIIPLERNDTKVKKILGDALYRYNKNMEKNPYYFRLDSVQSARKRYSPSATIYDITYTIQETDCERKTVSTICIVKDNINFNNC